MMENKNSNSAKSSKSFFIGTGSTLGVLSLLGACGGACSLATIPLGSLLAAIGLSSLSIYLPFLRWPLMALALVLSFFVLRAVVRQGHPVKVAGVSLLLGGALVFSGYQAFRVGPCGQQRGTLKAVFQGMTPTTQRVIKEGIYGLWPKLGRAPSVEEIRMALKFESAAPVLTAFEEIDKKVPEVFFEGTKNIKWVWPLSNLDHGVTVILDGEKPVHARCAVDALGISQMYGKPAKIFIKTPLYSQEIEFNVDGAKLASENSPVIVSQGRGCDDTLFFSSKEEFEKYKNSSHKEYLKARSLREAFDDGLSSFGSILSG